MSSTSKTNNNNASINKETLTRIKYQTATTSISTTEEEDNHHEINKNFKNIQKEMKKLSMETSNKWSIYTITWISKSALSFSMIQSQPCSSTTYTYFSTGLKLALIRNDFKLALSSIFFFFNMSTLEPHYVSLVDSVFPFAYFVDWVHLCVCAHSRSYHSA